MTDLIKRVDAILADPKRKRNTTIFAAVEEVQGNCCHKYKVAQRELVDDVEWRTWQCIKCNHSVRTVYFCKSVYEAVPDYSQPNVWWPLAKNIMLSDPDLNLQFYIDDGVLHLRITHNLDEKFVEWFTGDLAVSLAYLKMWREGGRKNDKDNNQD